MSISIAPGLSLAAGLAIAGYCLSAALARLPGAIVISPMMLTIVLGLLARNRLTLPAATQSGIRFGKERVLRLGIVLLGIHLSLSTLAAIGLRALPVSLICVVMALVVVTWLSRLARLPGRLGALLAVGTSICGVTAIVALGPAIRARESEISYAVACVTFFGTLAMLVYPFLAHSAFAGDAFRAGLFLGTAIHDTSQVIGAGVTYQQLFGDAVALDTATVSKLVRNLCMVVVIPALYLRHDREGCDIVGRSGRRSKVPAFVLGFALLCLLRTVGDLGERAFGLLEPAQWSGLVTCLSSISKANLTVAMAAVGLSTDLSGLRQMGLKPWALGLAAALLAGLTSFFTIEALY